MKQSSLGLGASTKRTRRREFLDEMDRVVPWADLVAQIAPFMPEGKRGVSDRPIIPGGENWITVDTRPPTVPGGIAVAHPLHAAVVHAE